jgi:hypothetical protein
MHGTVWCNKKESGIFDLRTPEAYHRQPIPEMFFISTTGKRAPFMHGMHGTRSKTQVPTTIELLLWSGHVAWWSQLSTGTVHSAWDGIHGCFYADTRPKFNYELKVIFAGRNSCCRSMARLS